jgi:hypothetical protein
MAGSLGNTGALARRFVQPPMRLTQGIDSRIDLAALAFEVADLRRDLLRQQTHLEFRLTGILSPASKDVMNLGQREPELFALKNHLEMKPVADIVPATGALPSRVQQATVLIKPEGPDAHLKIPRHFPDRRETRIRFRFGQIDTLYFRIGVSVWDAVGQPVSGVVLGVRVHGKSRLIDA